MRKQTWLTVNDIEAHFTDLCGLPDLVDPFDASERLIRTFADAPGSGNQRVCSHHLNQMRHDMEEGDDDTQ